MNSNLIGISYPNAFWYPFNLQTSAIEPITMQT